MKDCTVQFNLWSHAAKMEEVKVDIRHVMWEFKNDKNATETPKKISSGYSQDVITYCHVWDWFSKLHSGDRSPRDESRPGCSSNIDQDALRELMPFNPHKNTQKLTLDFNTFQSTIFCHLKMIKTWASWAFGFLINLVRRIKKIAYP